MEIDGLKYYLDTETKTAAIREILSMSITKVDVATVKYLNETYAVTSVMVGAFSNHALLESVLLPLVTSIDNSAFAHCGSLESVSLPRVTSIGSCAFYDCVALIALTVNSAFEDGWTSKKSGYGISGAVKPVVKFYTVKLTEGQCQDMTWDDYRIAWAYYNVPWREDVQVVPEGSVVVSKEQMIPGGCKVVPADAQVVQEGEIAVTKESIQAAKAETVSVVDGVVSLGVTVNTNGNFTAETKDWKPVELTENNVAVKDGRIVISIPVSDKSGFMILQSGDAKVGSVESGSADD